MVEALEQTDGAGPQPLVVLAGDTFSESNFEGCVRSAYAAVEKIRTHLLK